MTIVLENGHGETANQVIKEIVGMNLYPHEWLVADVPKGLGAYQNNLHFSVIGGELEIEVEGFPISAHAGAYVHIPAKQVHELKAYDNLHVYLGLKTKDIKELRRIHVANTLQGTKVHSIRCAHSAGRRYVY